MATVAVQSSAAASEEVEEGWQTLVDLKAQGKVRQIGASNFSVSQMQRVQAIHPTVSLQPPYSMIAREVEDGILPFCGEQNIGVICYSPMGKGLLTGAFSAARVAGLSAKDHRSRDPRFQSPQLEINLAFVESLGGIAAKLGWTLPELSIAWTLRRPELTSAIVGSRKPVQIAQTVIAGDRVLDSSSIAAIDSAIQKRDAALRALGELEKARV